MLDRPVTAGAEAGRADDLGFAIPAILRGDPAAALWKPAAASRGDPSPAPPADYGAHVRRRRRLGAAIAAVMAVIAISVVALMWNFARDDDAVQRTVAGRVNASQFDPTKLTVADPSQLLKLSAEDALTANEAIPVSAGPNPAAEKLIVSLADGRSYLRSADCLTAAIYYEAANEPDDGLRAVAQVVLNRVRHKAYPHTVCGVVFQGWERRTGCQFSFTCDGSLARQPSRNGWARANRFAVAALGGYVYEPLGLSTHYHADYVLPVWAKSLRKVAVIGRHIFYKWGGSYGAPAAFDTRYAGNEPNLLAGATNGALAIGELGQSFDAAQALVPSMARPVLDANGATLGGRVNLIDAPAAGATTVGKGQKPANVPAAGSRWILTMPPAKDIAPSAD